MKKYGVVILLLLLVICGILLFRHFGNASAIQTHANTSIVKQPDSIITENQNKEVGDAMENNSEILGNPNQGTMENIDPRSAIAEPVDMGVSVKWASFNVGASKPEEYGGLYGWADALGEKTSSNNDDYPSDNPPANISGTEYDIAHIQWGDTWRIPTKEEQEELIRECDWKKDSLNGVKGYTVTAKNGNTIFLPGVGGRIEDKTYYQVDGADYWSGTLGSNTDTAYYMYYYIGEEPTVGTLPRYYGFAVRAVCD